MFDSGDLVVATAQTGGEVGLIDPVRPGCPGPTEVGAAETMLQSAGAGPSITTLLLECSPTPVDLIDSCRVRCFSMEIPLSSGNLTRAAYVMPVLLPRLFTAFGALHCRGGDLVQHSRPDQSACRRRKAGTSNNCSSRSASIFSTAWPSVTPGVADATGWQVVGSPLQQSRVSQARWVLQWSRLAEPQHCVGLATTVTFRLSVISGSITVPTTTAHPLRRCPR